MTKNTEKTASSVWPLFLTAHAVLVSRIEARLSQAGLPPLVWYDVLWALERAPDNRLRMSELADMTVLSRSNLTRLVDRLESAGMVERARSEADRRGAFAVVTTSGKAMRRKIWPTYLAAIKELFDDHIESGEAEQMRTVLRRVLDAALESRDPQ